MEYDVNKGVGKQVEFKGLTAMYLFILAGGLAAFALTDHDTVEGLDELLSYAETLRRTLPPEEAAKVPEVIPGIEFSTEYQGQDIHIVGLDIDYRQPEFSTKLQSFIDSRTNRNRKCVSAYGKPALILLMKPFWRLSRMPLLPEPIMPAFFLNTGM